MNTATFNRADYYTITQLSKALGVSFRVVYEKVESGALQPDYIAPFTNKKYFSKQTIENKYLTSSLQRAQA